MKHPDHPGQRIAERPDPEAGGILPAAGGDRQGREDPGFRWFTLWTGLLAVAIAGGLIAWNHRHPLWPPSADKKPNASAVGLANLPKTGFVASLRGGVYHLPTCRHAARITADHLVAYDTAADAQFDGLRPCGSCLKTAAKVADSGGSGPDPVQDSPKGFEQ